MFEKPANILAHKYLGLNLFDCAGKFKKQCATCFLKTETFSGIRKSLTRKTARQKIDFSTQRGKVDVVDITLYDIPLRTVTAQGLAGAMVELIEEKMPEACLFHAESKPSATRKQLDGSITVRRRDVHFIMPAR